jgi:gamma-glutamylcyclotransferase
MFYFAYCTMLDIEETKKYCPTARPLGVMRLPGYRVGFARYSPNPSEGGCTLEKAPGRDLYGVLYEMAEEEMKTLDRASGVDKGYWTRLDVQLIDGNGEKVPAQTYMIPKPFGAYRPPKSYTRPILTGARAFSLPGDYIAELEEIIRSSETNS